MKKGFTLIELLAVIVILAIIALIAAPVVLNIINDSKKQSNERSMEMYKSAISDTIARNQLNGTEIRPGNLSQEFLDTVEYDGARVVCRINRLNENGSIYLQDCTVDGVKVESKGNKFIHTAPDTCYLSLSDGVISYYNPNASDCGRPGEIPSSLKVSQPTVTPNKSKCLAYIDEVSKKDLTNRYGSVDDDIEEAIENPNAYCDELISFIQVELQNIDYSEILAILVFDYDYFEDYLDDFEDMIIYASLDISIDNPSGESKPVTTIGSTAFAMRDLTSVTIPSTVNTIQDSAFAINKLSSITLPNGLTTIGSSAFYENEFTSITIPASVTYIGYSVFSNNNKLKTVIFEGSSRTQSLTIENYAFERDVNSVIINSNPNHFNFRNDTFEWYSDNSCRMTTDGDLTTSSCITINN